MSRMSHFFICVMAAGLAFMAGLRVYEVYERRAAADKTIAPATATFQNIPVLSGPVSVEPGILQPLPAPGSKKEVFLHDEPLAAHLEEEQARQTLGSILEDYRQNPTMQAFYADLRQATGRTDITLETLSGENLGSLMRQYPQLQGVVAKHAQDPEFARLVQEIFANPQFVRSVSVLQGGTAARQ